MNDKNTSLYECNAWKIYIIGTMFAVAIHFYICIFIAQNWEATREKKTGTTSQFELVRERLLVCVCSIYIL